MEDPAYDSGREWLYCSKCSWDSKTADRMRNAGVQVKDRELYVMECGHIYCEQCLNSAKKPSSKLVKCIECDTEFAFYLIQERSLPEKFKPFFECPLTLMEQAVEVYRFQQSRLISLARIMKQKLISQKFMLDRVKTSLQERERLARENKALKEELERFKAGKLNEFASQKSFVDTPTISHRHNPFRPQTATLSTPKYTPTASRDSSSRPVSSQLRSPYLRTSMSQFSGNVQPIPLYPSSQAGSRPSSSTFFNGTSSGPIRPNTRSNHISTRATSKAFNAKYRSKR